MALQGGTDKHSPGRASTLLCAARIPPCTIRGGDSVDWDGIVKIVQSLGFPVACVIAMFCMWQREVSSHKEEMESMRKTVEEQNRATVEALNNNTQVLNRILQKIGE